MCTSAAKIRSPNFIENGLEQLAMELGGHSIGAVDADQTGMKRNVGKLPTGPRILCRTAKIDAIPCHKGPVTL